jgi:hypothetical protein
MKLQNIIRVICATTFAAILFVGFQACAQTKSQAQSGWIADRKTGCKIWNAEPQQDESVTWSGPCKNGLAEGHGTLQWFEHGQPDARYEGEYQGGQRNGYGVETEANGTQFKGEFRDDEPVTMAPNEINFIKRH